MDWFERLTGFRESGYSEIHRQLVVEGERLRSWSTARPTASGGWSCPPWPNCASAWSLRPSR